LLCSFSNTPIAKSLIKIKSGKAVKEAGYLRFDIENNKGNITSIPYHYIYGKKISRYGNNHHLEKVTIEFECPEHLNTSDVIERIKKEVMNTSWVALSEPPIIESTKVVNGQLFVMIRVYLQDKAQVEKVKRVVSSYLLSTSQNESGSLPAK
jgi:hypothetical protein